MHRFRQLIRRALAFAAALAVSAGLAACGQSDTRTHITVWGWEPSLGEVIRRFEAANPDIAVDIKNDSDYYNLNVAIQDGYGMPDVAQIEYHALRQYAVSSQLLDLTDRIGSDYADFYSPGTWSSVQLAGKIYGLPMDSGPMAFFYNKDVFDQAGVDATQIKTWDDYYEAAKKLKSIGVYIAADAGDASFYDAMIWLAGGQPFHTSQDGKTVTVNLEEDKGTEQFTAFWQKMIDEDLVDTELSTWSDDWKKAIGTGTVASVFSGAWMPSLLLSDVPGTAGLWRVAAMPTMDGQTTNAENGGSAMCVLQSTRKPDAAYRFVDFVTHDARGIGARVDGGAFPADLNTLSDTGFLTKTTIKDARGIDIAYFGGQEFNRVLARAAESVSVNYQYLPFEVYARTDFRTTVGKAYQWESDKSQDKITLKQGIATWQKDLKEYGVNQGFTIQ